MITMGFYGKASIEDDWVERWNQPGSLKETWDTGSINEIICFGFLLEEPTNLIVEASLS